MVPSLKSISIRVVFHFVIDSSILLTSAELLSYFHMDKWESFDPESMYPIMFQLATFLSIHSRNPVTEPSSISC